MSEAEAATTPVAAANRPHFKLGGGGGGGGNYDTQDLVDVIQLIDLTDKPIELSRDEIGWSKVKANASNCICCCSKNSVALVTTDASYILDHIPLTDVQCAQANASLQQLALSNHCILVIIDLVNVATIDDASHDDTDHHHHHLAPTSNNGNGHGQSIKATKFVNLSAYELTMNDVVYWRWLDDNELAIVTYETLFICNVNQPYIGHHAFTALRSRPCRPLSMERICDVHPHIANLCQVTDVQRDATNNLYAISSLYSTSSLLNLTSTSTQQQTPKTAASPQAAAAAAAASKNHHHPLTAALRPSFGSVPSRLSQLTRNNISFESLNSEHLFDRAGSQDNLAAHDDQPGGEICGLVQVYCRHRERSQLIRAHAMTFTSAITTLEPPAPATLSGGQSSPPPPPLEASAHDERPDGSSLPSPPSTILVAANKTENKIRVHFVEMFTPGRRQTGQDMSQTSKFDLLSSVDFPTSIICSYLEPPPPPPPPAQVNDCGGGGGGGGGGAPLHVASILTKYGQLFVCSVTHGTILFNVNLCTDIVSSAILESKTQGLMVICRNGQILLVNLNVQAIMRLLDERRALRCVASSNSLSSSMDSNHHILQLTRSARDSREPQTADHIVANGRHHEHRLQAERNSSSSSPLAGTELDFIISTKL